MGKAKVRVPTLPPKSELRLCDQHAKSRDRSCTAWGASAVCRFLTRRYLSLGNFWAVIFRDFVYGDVAVKFYCMLEMLVVRVISQQKMEGIWKYTIRRINGVYGALSVTAIARLPTFFFFGFPPPPPHFAT